MGRETGWAGSIRAPSAGLESEGRGEGQQQNNGKGDTFFRWQGASTWCCARAGRASQIISRPALHGRGPRAPSIVLSEVVAVAQKWLVGKADARRTASSRAAHTRRYAPTPPVPAGITCTDRAPPAPRGRGGVWTPFARVPFPRRCLARNLGPSAFLPALPAAAARHSHRPGEGTCVFPAEGGRSVRGRPDEGRHGTQRLRN